MNKSAEQGLRGCAVLGDFYHAPNPHRFECLKGALLFINASGVIEAVHLPDAQGFAEALDRAGQDLVLLPEGSLVLPGLVDTHVHAPQYAQLGRALDEPLEVWLDTYTFPLEARYKDLAFARERYTVLVADLLAGGTTTALYFATLDLEPTRLLAEICLEQGQRALVGKVAMDHPEGCPDFYRDRNAYSAVADTRALIEYLRHHPGNTDQRVLPCITPRFVPACTDEALAGLGRLAQETGAHVQTHCSESDWAHAYALERFGKTDAEALDGFGLLTRRSVLAHSNFLTEGDVDRLVARGSAVSHCPLSNAYFANAVFPLRRALERRLHVGLGTDISGGPSASMFQACRDAVQVSRMLEDGVDPDLPAEQRGRPNARIDMVTAFHLATAGGGMALDLPIGIFAPGYKFDAVLIDPDARKGGIRLFEENEPQRVLEAVLYGANTANISAVWVDGRQVSGAF